MEEILKVENLSKHFVGLKAVDDLSFSINKNDIFGLIGPNGAGKTTVFNCLSSYLPVTSGRVIFKGEDITKVKPHLLPERGLARTFQANRLFMDMTVKENVLVAVERARKISALQEFFSIGNFRAVKAELDEKSDSILETMGLLDQGDIKAKNLPHGFQRQLGVAMALATGPELLLMDEPLTGITPEEMDVFLDIIRKIKGSGVTVCLVEHNMRAVMSICDTILVIHYGKKLCEGTPEHVCGDQSVIEAYLGGREVKF